MQMSASDVDEDKGVAAPKAIKVETDSEGAAEANELSTKQTLAEVGLKVVKMING